MRTLPFGALLLLGLLACCAAPPAEQAAAPAGRPAQVGRPRVAEPPPADDRRQAPPPLAPDRKSAVLLTIGDRPVLAREVVELLIERHRPIFDQVVQDLLIQRVLAAENERHSIVIPEKLLAEELRQELEKAERYAQVQFQIGLAKLLERQGRSLAQFKAAAREKTRYRHTLERMVRYDQLRHGAVKVRHIVVKEQAAAQRLRDKLAQGADFIQLARQHSTGPSKENGGLLPMVTPGILAEPEVERQVLVLAPGQTSGVIRSRMGYHVFRALYRHPAAEQKSYRQLEPQVVASLERYPLLGDVEVNFWLKKLRRKYPIKQFF